MKLQGKNAIVTGSNRGIGFATVKRFAQEGCNVWACARKQYEEFENELKVLSERYHVWIKPVYFELSDETEIKEGLKSIMKEKLPIDILVNNAGIPFGGLMMMTPVSKLKEVFEINYFAQILITQLVVRIMMRQKSGSIINMASVGGIETEPGYLAYGSSKAALIWATKCMAKELGPHGIRINAVAPGLTQTSMGNYKNEEELNKVINRTSLHRMAEPDEICQAITYLASDEASFVTGHILVVDGGRSI
ncbi:MAG: SDR family oxidoreductase [Prevotella sp.]|nr:SDR family oxidoreductase [Prevotella sp.]MBP3843523.1 SDR family oxidoreductase [Prevotella sp.]